MYIYVYAYTCVYLNPIARYQTPEFGGHVSEFLLDLVPRLRGEHQDIRAAVRGAQNQEEEPLQGPAAQATPSHLESLDERPPWRQFLNIARELLPCGSLYNRRGSTLRTLRGLLHPK